MNIKLFTALLISASISGVVGCGATQKSEPAPIQSKAKVIQGDPNKVPFDNFFKGVDYTNMRISPDGKHFSAGKVKPNGELEIFIIDRRTMKVKSTMSLKGRLGISKAIWATNERVLFEVGYDSALSEGFSGGGMIVAMNVDGSRKDVLWNGITDDYGGGEGGMLMGKMDDKHYKVLLAPSGSSMAKFPYYYTYRLNIYTGKTKRLTRSPIRTGKPVVRKVKGEAAEITHWVGSLPDSFSHTVVMSKGEGGDWQETVYDQKKGSRVPLGWSKDGDYIYYEDTIDGSTKGLLKIHAKTGEEELIYRHPKVDYGQVLKDEDGEIWGVSIMYDYPKVVILKPKNHYAKIQKKMEASFPNSVIQIASKTSDNNEWVIHVSNDTHPGKYYIYNQYDDSVKFLVNMTPHIDPKTIPQTHPIRFQARDGMEINGYITLPVGKQPKGLPMIILPHGGPHGPRDTWGYNGERIILANEGYAVLVVNYRGSGGYGRDFMFDWYGHWGLEMQDDLTDATHWAIQQGIAKKDKICIYGASYGGYATLMGLVKEPELYQCGIGYVGVYDLNVMMTKGDVGMRQAGKKYLKEALGATEEKRRAQSPAPNSERITKPVFLIHGDRDGRAHYRNFEVMRDALKAQNHRFETLRIPRAGHGARTWKSRKEIFCRMIHFFNRHIGEGTPSDGGSNECVAEGTEGLPYKYYEGGA